MEKLYGLISSLALIMIGSYFFAIGYPAALSAAVILGGIGLSLFFERRVIKEASMPSEKAVSTLIPVITELALIGVIGFTTAYLSEAMIYLGLAFFLTDLLPRFDGLFEINTSRLLGRISRVIVLSLGIAGSQLNSFILFYGLAAAGLIALYDIAVVFAEMRSSI